MSYRWLITILSGLFMFLTLYVYRAYHIDEVMALTGHSMFFRAMTHTVIIAAVFFLIETYLSPRLKIKPAVKPLVTAALATFIGLNFTYLAFNYFYQWTVFSWYSYFQFYYEYPLILVIPVTLSYLINRVAHPQSASEPSPLISISSENQKEHFQIKPENLLFIKSADNYVEIHYRTRVEVKKHLLRKSLKDIEQAYAESAFLVRSHRSYLVNPANIDQVSKSNSKFELTLAGITIPVSKSYAGNLLEKHPHLFAPHSEISSQTA